MGDAGQRRDNNHRGREIFPGTRQRLTLKSRLRKEVERGSRRYRDLPAIMSEPRIRPQSSADISYSRDIPTAVLGTVKNIVKPALKYYTVSARKQGSGITVISNIFSKKNQGLETLSHLNGRQSLPNFEKKISKPAMIKTYQVLSVLVTNNNHK